MKLAVYNHMFGMDGTSFISNILCHYYLHYSSNVKKVFSKINLQDTFKTIKKSQADILALVEVYEGTEKAIIQGLKKQGYKYFFIGRGHKFKYSPNHILILIASKLPGRQIKLKSYPLENEFGGGGGIVKVKFKNFNLIGVHLGLPKRKSYLSQLSFIENIVRKTKGKLILMGDFNNSLDKLNFPSLDIATGKIKTCLTTPIMRWFYFTDTDHVFTRGFQSSNPQVIDGKSDHKLLYVDIN